MTGVRPSLRTGPPMPAPPADDAPTQRLRVTPVPAPRPAPAGPAPAPDARRAPDRRNGLGTPALVLGALAAGTGWIAGWAGIVLGLFAVAAGYLGARRAFHRVATDGASSLGGLVLGLVGLVAGAIVVWPSLFGTGTFGDGLTLDQCLASAPTAKEQHMCKSQHLQEFNQRFPGAAE